jgi:hypothetical protein
MDYLARGLSRTLLFFAFGTDGFCVCEMNFRVVMLEVLQYPITNCTTEPEQ